MAVRWVLHRTDPDPCPRRHVNATRRVGIAASRSTRNCPCTAGAARKLGSPAAARSAGSASCPVRDRRTRACCPSRTRGPRAGRAPAAASWGDQSSERAGEAARRVAAAEVEADRCSAVRAVVALPDRRGDRAGPRVARDGRLGNCRRGNSLTYSTVGTHRAVRRERRLRVGVRRPHREGRAAVLSGSWRCHRRTVPPTTDPRHSLAVRRRLVERVRGRPGAGTTPSTYDWTR